MVKEYHHNFASALEEISRLQADNKRLIKENALLKAPEKRFKRINLMLKQNLDLRLKRAILDATEQSNKAVN